MKNSNFKRFVAMMLVVVLVVSQMHFSRGVKAAPDGDAVPEISFEITDIQNEGFYYKVGLSDSIVNEINENSISTFTITVFKKDADNYIEYKKFDGLTSADIEGTEGSYYVQKLIDTQEKAGSSYYVTVEYSYEKEVVPDSGNSGDESGNTEGNNQEQQNPDEGQGTNGEQNPDEGNGEGQPTYETVERSFSSHVENEEDYYVLGFDCNIAYINIFTINQEKSENVSFSIEIGGIYDFSKFPVNYSIVAKKGENELTLVSDKNVSATSFTETLDTTVVLEKDTEISLSLDEVNSKSGSLNTDVNVYNNIELSNGKIDNNKASVTVGFKNSTQGFPNASMLNGVEVSFYKDDQILGSSRTANSKAELEISNASVSKDDTIIAKVVKDRTEYASTTISSESYYNVDPKVTGVTISDIDDTAEYVNKKYTATLTTTEYNVDKKVVYNLYISDENGVYSMKQENIEAEVKNNNFEIVNEDNSLYYENFYIEILSVTAGEGDSNVFAVDDVESEPIINWCDVTVVESEDFKAEITINGSNDLRIFKHKDRNVVIKTTEGNYPRFSELKVGGSDVTAAVTTSKKGEADVYSKYENKLDFEAGIKIEGKTDRAVVSSAELVFGIGDSGEFYPGYLYTVTPVIVMEPQNAPAPDVKLTLSTKDNNDNELGYVKFITDAFEANEKSEFKIAISADEESKRHWTSLPLPSPGTEADTAARRGSASENHPAS